MQPTRRVITALTVAVAALLPAPASRADAASIGFGVAHGSIRTGDLQTVTVRGTPAQSYDVRVTMPDGETISQWGQIRSASGLVRWSYIQPPGTITRASRLAAVRLKLGNRAYATAYRIVFDAIDVVVPRKPVAENSDLVLWVHTQPRARVRLQLWSALTRTKRSVVTGRNGWASMSARVMNGEPPFEQIAMTFVASTILRGSLKVARGDFQVLPFHFLVSLQQVQIFHQVCKTSGSRPRPFGRVKQFVCREYRLSRSLRATCLSAYRHTSPRSSKGEWCRWRRFNVKHR